MRELVETENAPSPIGPYCQAVKANGFVFVSGQIPLDPSTGTIVGSDIEEQTRQVMKNLKAILDAAGGGLESIVKTTIYVTNLDDFSKLNEVYAEYFAGQTLPVLWEQVIGATESGFVHVGYTDNYIRVRGVCTEVRTNHVTPARMLLYDGAEGQMTVKLMALS